MPKSVIRIFISHSNTQKQFAGRLRKKLIPFGFDVFLAHEDLKGGEEWVNTIHRKIVDCDIFIVVLSDEYHEANFTDHELGIAYAHRKPIIPISTDGKLPYGFMSKFQSMPCCKNLTQAKLREIVDLILAKAEPLQQEINGLVDLFSKSQTYAAANRYASQLFTYKTFTKEQVNKMAKAYINNSQIRGAWTAQPLAAKALRDYKQLVERDMIKKLKSIFP